MTNRGTAFATTVRVIAGVHDRTTAAGTNAHVALAASLAQVDVLVVEVRNNADGGDAVQTNVAHLAGGQTNQSVTIFLSHQLSHDASGTDQLAALAGIQLNVVDHGTDGDVLEGQSVTGLDVGVGAGHDLVANLQTIGSQDVALDAVLILDEGDEGRTVRIVYTAHDSQLVCPNHLMQRPSGELCQECLGQKQWNCTKHKCIHNSRVKSLLGSVEAKIYQHNHAYRMFDTVICPSHFLEEVLKTNPNLDGKTVTMHNFLPEQELCPVKKEDYVLYFGRFSEEKGIKTLLKACEKLNDIPFVFAGKGPLENEVNQLRNVKNIGFTKGKKLYQTIAAAKFVVFPSEWYENCPFSVIEAQYYGTPVIASRIGGTVELIKEGMTGEFFEPGNQKELEEKIRNLWGDSERLEEYTRNCKETDFLNLDEYCEKLLQIYGGLKA